MIDAKELLQRYQAGTCTESEQRYVEDWLLRYRASEDAGLTPDDYQRLRGVNWMAVRARTIAMRRTRGLYRRWVGYAAAILLVASVVGWLVIDGRWSADSDRWSVVRDGNDIAPGGNRATLTLADGRTIDLSEAQTGIVVGDEIVYLDGSAVLGEQVNEGTGEQAGGAERNHKFTNSQVHTLTTPKGGTYQITLPDGSKVWLNANSTLKYPSRFSGEERVVELIGEAYFEISEQWSVVGGQPLREQKIPFLVKTSAQTVEVLGTQFNISAYADEEETKTTLVEGKVKVTPGTAQDSTPDRPLTTDHRPPITLSPGEQATIRGTNVEVKQVETDQYTVWRDGKFDFSEQTLEAIMRQLVRWYDVEVEYDGVDKYEKYWGSVSRFSNLSQVLDKLEQTGDIRFVIKGRRVVVSKAE